LQSKFCFFRFIIIRIVTRSSKAREAKGEAKEEETVKIKSTQRQKGRQERPERQGLLKSQVAMVAKVK
jgi:hypothetical protein